MWWTFGPVTTRSTSGTAPPFLSTPIRSRSFERNSESCLRSWKSPSLKGRLSCRPGANRLPEKAVRKSRRRKVTHNLV
uniref:Uncharacterized protein MANES_05G156800 n=1 Tax=Rhizophora mucronata TaxID=61149 RepID=A0A2P2J507_RHIMU